MSERRQIQLVWALAAIFVLSLVLFMVSLFGSQNRIQATINANAVRRDAQMVVLIRGMADIQRGNRAIGCILGIDPTIRTPEAVDKCFTDQGLAPP